MKFDVFPSTTTNKVRLRVTRAAAGRWSNGWPFITWKTPHQKNLQPIGQKRTDGAERRYTLHTTIAQLIHAGPVVTDGAWGTQLQRLGLPVGDCPDAWNLAHPERVEQVARSYVEAGSRIVLTNTFGANRFVLERYGLADRAEEIVRAGIEISRRAAADIVNSPLKKSIMGSLGSTAGLSSSEFAGISSFTAGQASSGTLFQRAVKVFASIGPSGKMLMMGQVTEGELRAAFSQHARTCAEASADGIVIETMSDPAEAALAIAAARETGLPVVACMTFDAGADKDRTLTGATPERAAEVLAAAGADVIGSNCGHGIDDMVKVCRRLHAATDRPVWIKANAGLPELVGGEIVYRQTPAQFAAYAPQLVEAGASFVGGCCGTSPEFIRAVAQQLHK